MQNFHMIQNLLLIMILIIIGIIQIILVPRYFLIVNYLKKIYKLIVCNFATGCNAFFVKESYADLFPEVPSDIKDIYVPAKYWVKQ